MLTYLQTVPFKLITTLALSSFLCVTVAQQNSPSSFVYVSNAESNSISTFSLVGEDKPVLSLVNHMSLEGADGASLSTPMTLTNDLKTLYIVTRNESPSLYQYSLNASNGKLGLKNKQAIENSYAYILLSQHQESIYGASYPKHILSNYAVDKTGKAIHQQSLGEFKNAHAIAIHPKYEHVLVPALGDDSVEVFERINKANALMHRYSITLPTNSGPRHIVFHPSGDAAYVVGEFDAQVYKLVFDASDNLKQWTYKIAQQVSMMQAAQINKIEERSTDPAKPFKSADIKITNDGKYVFATERRSNSLCSFKVNQENLNLKLIQCTDTEAWPRGIQIANDHNAVIVAGKNSAHISLYKIENDGTLDFVSRHQTQSGPNWIELVATGEQ